MVVDSSPVAVDLWSRDIEDKKSMQPSKIVDLWSRDIKDKNRILSVPFSEQD